MTHSLHRSGDDLRRDYVVLAMGAMGFNKEEAGEKLKVISRIMLEHDPVNMGDAGYGSLMGGQTKEDFLSGRTPKVITAVYTDAATMERVLAAIKAADLGVSVVVSGLAEEVETKVAALGLEMHTINLSAGYFGRTELIAEPEILEFTSMCGHHMIAPDLVRHVLEEYRGGRMDLAAGAAVLGKHCVCGIFNAARAKELLVKYGGRGGEE